MPRKRKFRLKRVSTLQWKCEKYGKLHEWSNVWSGRRQKYGYEWFEKYGKFWEDHGVKLVKVEGHYFKKVKIKE